MRALSLFLVGISFMFAPAASAHVVGYTAIETRLTANAQTLHLHTEVENNFIPTYLTNHFGDDFAVSYQGTPCTFATTTNSLATSTIQNRYVFEGIFTCSAPITTITDLSIKSTAFREYFQTFDHFVHITIGDTEWNIVFTQEVGDFPGQVKATAANYVERFFEVAKQFTWMGMMHIFTGYDHILFLLSVILLMRSLRRVLLLVTSFTVAHSITLLLASFHVISLPSTIVEPLIALSIVYMALRNIMILRGSEATNPPLGERWAATFGFGLIHGLGFASALTATSIPQEFFVPALVIFNVGIELGQLTILVVAIPLLLWLDKQRRSTSIFKYVSIAILAIALLWFVERLY